MIRYLVFLWLLAAHFPATDKNIPKVHTVEIKGMKFLPEVLEIKKGDQVIWVNKDVVIHNVTNESGTWASPAIPIRKSWKRTIESSAKYYCSLHPVMKGSIVVK